MDFALTKEQEALQQAAIRFAQAELADDLIARDHTGTFWHEGWKRCAAFGVQGLPVPAEYGGRAWARFPARPHRLGNPFP